MLRPILKFMWVTSVLSIGLFFATPIPSFTVPMITSLAPVHVQPIKVDMQQLSCLAKNIFFEASGESINGQAAVARVVMNRVRHGFARTPCGVVYQAAVIEKIDENGDIDRVRVCQFSWVCEGKDDPSKASPRYKQAEAIAHAVLTNTEYHDVVPNNTLFFHNTTVNPGWKYRRVAVIGNHTFYAK